MPGKARLNFGNSRKFLSKLHKMAGFLLHIIPKIAVTARNIKFKTKSLLRKTQEMVSFRLWENPQYSYGGNIK